MLQNSRQMKDSIFENIYKKFTRGEKLKRYDFYLREQETLAYLKDLKEERQRLQGQPLQTAEALEQEKRRLEKELKRQQ